MSDAGVSALGQVVALYVKDPGSDQVDFVKILNSLLPDDIRVTGWAWVPDDFSARMGCRTRTYKYFFPRGGLDVPLMREAAKAFVGIHDFRNFSKLDKSMDKLDATRWILGFEIVPVSSHERGEFGLFAAVVTGQSFLWHQIRCMMAVLLEVGLGRERPEVVGRLLDVEAHPRKPQYPPAPADPLVLTHCGYPGITFQTNFKSVNRLLSMLFLRHMSQAQFFQEALCTLEADESDGIPFSFWRVCERSHTPLTLRATVGTDQPDKRTSRKQQQPQPQQQQQQQQQQEQPPPQQQPQQQQQTQTPHKQWDFRAPFLVGLALVLVARGLMTKSSRR